MRARAALPLAAAAGVVSALAFDPVALPYAMLVGVAVLVAVLRALRDARKRLVLGVGAVFGAAFMAPLIWWMNAVSEGAYVGLVLAQVFFLSLGALPLRAALRLPGWPLWGAAAWVLVEEVRSAVPFSGFPWGRLVHTAVDTPFAPWVRLIGMPATSALLFVVAAALVAVVAGRRRLVAAATVVATVVVGSLLPTGLAGPAGTRDVAIVQGDTPGAFLTWPRGEILGLHLDETRRLARAVEAGDVPRPDAVLWPENATDVDPFTNDAVRTQVEALVDRLGAPILVGGILDGPSADTALNAGVVWDTDGPGDRYVKRMLVPYGEYVPFRQQLGGLVPRFDRDIPRDMVPGDTPGALRLGDMTVADTICWDIAYDGIVHEAVDAGGQVLVVQTSNASFTGTSQPEQQFKISRLRAIETGREVLVPSTNGISGVADAHGDTVARAAVQQPETISHEVTLASGATPAMVVGRWLGWALSALGVLAWVLGTVWLRRRTPRDDETPAAAGV